MAATAMSAARCLLFDLDGTLTDNYQGIRLCLGHALEQAGRELPDEEAFRRCVGPPLRASFAQLLATSDCAAIEAAVGLYRQRYATHGWRENAVYPGIEDALESLVAAGDRLFLCTSKPRIYAERIVEHFGLARHLLGVHGPELDGRLDDKRDLLGALLATERLAPARCVMIGDRAQDMLAARANGVPALGVLWGYGSRDELMDSGARALVHRPRDLAAALAAF